MSSIALVIASHLPPPILGKCCVVAVTTSSAITDLTADTAIKLHLADASILTFLADGVDVYIAFNNVSSGTIDETQATGATSCFKLVSNQPTPMQMAKGYTFMLVKAASACKLRIFASGFNDMKSVGT